MHYIKVHIVLVLEYSTGVPRQTHTLHNTDTVLRPISPTVHTVSHMYDYEGVIQHAVL